MIIYAHKIYKMGIYLVFFPSASASLGFSPILDSHPPPAFPDQPYPFQASNKFTISPCNLM